PVFTVTAVQAHSPQLQGFVSRWLWVGEGHTAYLYLGDDRFVEGRFRNVDVSTKSASFAFESPESAPDIRPNESIRYIHGYWGEKAIISLDRSLNWQELTFQPRDAIKTYNDGRTEEIPGGWDHEHCALCQATISLEENTVF